MGGYLHNRVGSAVYFKVTKYFPISHHARTENFDPLTFLKRGIFTLVKILFRPVPHSLTVAPAFHVRFFHFPHYFLSIFNRKICITQDFLVTL